MKTVKWKDIPFYTYCKMGDAVLFKFLESDHADSVLIIPPKSGSQAPNTPMFFSSFPSLEFEPFKPKTTRIADLNPDDEFVHRGVFFKGCVREYGNTYRTTYAKDMVFWPHAKKGETAYFQSDTEVIKMCDFYEDKEAERNNFYMLYVEGSPNRPAVCHTPDTAAREAERLARVTKKRVYALRVESFVEVSGEPPVKWFSVA